MNILGSTVDLFFHFFPVEGYFEVSFPQIEGLKIEDVVCCTLCKAPLGEFVIWDIGAILIKIRLKC